MDKILNLNVNGSNYTDSTSVTKTKELEEVTSVFKKLEQTQYCINTVVCLSFFLKQTLGPFFLNFEEL